MPSKLGSQIDNMIKYYIREEMKDVVKKFANRGQHVHKEIRKNIYKKWYGKYNKAFRSMWNATEFDLPEINLIDVNNGIYEIIFSSHINLDKYKDKKHAEAWKKRNEEKYGFSSLYRSGEYVANLQIETHDWGATVGLPRETSDSLFFTKDSYMENKIESWDANVPKQRKKPKFIRTQQEIKGKWVNPAWHKVGRERGLDDELNDSKNWIKWMEEFDREY